MLSCKIAFIVRQNVLDSIQMGLGFVAILHHKIVRVENEGVHSACILYLVSHNQ